LRGEKVAMKSFNFPGGAMKYCAHKVINYKKLHFRNTSAAASDIKASQVVFIVGFSFA